MSLPYDEHIALERIRFAHQQRKAAAALMRLSALLGSLTAAVAIAEPENAHLEPGDGPDDAPPEPLDVARLIDEGKPDVAELIDQAADIIHHLVPHVADMARDLNNERRLHQRARQDLQQIHDYASARMRAVIERDSDADEAPRALGPS